MRCAPNPNIGSGHSAGASGGPGKPDQGPEAWPHKGLGPQRCLRRLEFDARYVPPPPKKNLLFPLFARLWRRRCGGGAPSGIQGQSPWSGDQGSEATLKLKVFLLSNVWQKRQILASFSIAYFANPVSHSYLWQSVKNWRYRLRLHEYTNHTGLEL